jgi:hypothetical protein
MDPIRVETCSKTYLINFDVFEVLEFVVGIYKSDLRTKQRDRYVHKNFYGRRMYRVDDPQTCVKFLFYLELKEDFVLLLWKGDGSSN